MASESQRDWLKRQLLPDQKKRVELAACMRRVSVTDFMVDCIDKAAVQIIQQESAGASGSRPNPLFLPALDSGSPIPAIRAEQVSKTEGKFTVEPLPAGFAVIVKIVFARLLMQANTSMETAADLIPPDDCAIQRISFKIGVAGRGHPAGHEKLTLEIATEGDVLPAERLRRALDTFRGNITNQATRKANLTLSLDEAACLSDTLRTMNCLRNANIRTIGELIQKTETDVLKLSGSGRKVLQEIKETLLPFGFSLGMIIDEHGYPQPGPTSVLSSAILALAQLRLDP